nr:AI-2E family transporter [Pseudenhygromyxa sp. WMMC2535]
MLFVLLCLIFFRRVLLPFVFGALIAYLLEPLVRRIGPRIGRAGAVAVVYVVLLGLLVGFFGGLLPGVISDLARLSESTPEAVQTLNDEWLPRASAWFESTFPGLLPAESTPRGVQESASELVVEPLDDGSYRVDLRELHLEVHDSGGGWVIQPDRPRQDSFGAIVRDLVASKGDELTEAAAATVRGVVTGVAAFLTDFVLAFLVAAFVLVDLDRIQRFIRSLIPPRHREQLGELIEGIDEGMAGVVRGQILICLVNGTLAYIGLRLFGVHYSLLLAMIAALFSVVPVAGILVATIPIMGVALLSGDVGLSGLAFGKSAAMLGWLVVIHLFEASYLNPKIIGIASNIHPVVLLFALLAGFEVAGVLGLVLAIPVASVVQTGVIYARKRANVGRPRKRTTRRGLRSASHPAAGSGSRPVLVDDEPKEP